MGTSHERDGYRYVVYYTYRQWIGKPDPSGFGRAHFFTNHPQDVRARLTAQGHRVNRVVETKGDR